jgi:hypothetical protein
VPLSLQLLLENTVKHNVVSEQPAVRIYVRGDYLAVQNDYQRRKCYKNVKALVLKYYQSIRNHYKRKFDCPKRKTFTVKIPILTKQIIVMDTYKLQRKQCVLQSKKKRVEELKGFYGNPIHTVALFPFNIYKQILHFQWFWFLLGWGFD